MRDLLNWCNRVAHGFDPTSSTALLHIFQEAMDCFTAMLSEQTKKTENGRGYWEQTEHF